MTDSEPTSRVAVGQYVLVVGASAGTLITPGAAASSDATPLAHALEAQPSRRTPAEAAADAVDAVSDATGGVEDAVELFNALASGAILEPRELAKRIEPLLALLDRLDRDGRYREALQLARAVNGLLALALRWVDLVRSLNVAVHAARELGDDIAIAWTEHELGTLHLAAGDPVGAETRLARARDMRERLEDPRALAATEQNLRTLCQHLRELLRHGALSRRAPRGRRRLILAAAALLLLLVGAVAGAVVDRDSTETLTVRVEGRGNVTSDLAGIRCPGICSATVARGQRVSLTASARRGSTFAGWRGDCTGTRRCRVRIDGARTLTARFERTRGARRLTVQKEGDGDGRVTSQTSGIDCGATCATSVERGDRVRLAATPAAEATFSGWSGGGCTGRGACVVNVRRDVTITARFAATAVASGDLTVTTAGDGTGRVTSDPAGISCEQGCTGTFREGQAVVLTAVAGEGSEFGGWNGAGCSGRNRCTVTLRAAPQSVTATFSRRREERFTLITSTSGSGTGTIARQPECSTPCDYEPGTAVTLTATQADDSVFVSWEGCEPAAEPTCTVTMSQDRTVSATFEVNPGPE